MWKRFIRALGGAISAAVISLMLLALIAEIATGITALVPSRSYESVMGALRPAWGLACILLVVVSAYRQARQTPSSLSWRTWLPRFAKAWAGRIGGFVGAFACIAIVFAFSSDWRGMIAGRFAGETTAGQLPTRVWLDRFERGVPSSLNEVLNLTGANANSADRMALEQHLPSLVPHLLESLKANDPHEQDAASQIFGRIGPKAEMAIPELETLMMKDEQRVCESAADALSKMGAAAIPSLCRGLSTRHAADQCRSGLLSMPSEAVPAMIEILKNRPKNPMLAPDEMIQAMAVLQDLKESSKPAVPVLIDILSEYRNEEQLVSTYTRWKKAAEALATISPSAEPALVEMLTHSSWMVRDLAATSLERVAIDAQSVAAIPVIIRAFDTAMDEPYSSVLRSKLARVLARFGDNAIAALPTLKARLAALSERNDLDVRREIARAIWKIGNNPDIAVKIAMEQISPSASDFARSWDQDAAFLLLEEIGPDAKASIPLLVELVEKSVWSHAVHAVWVIDRAVFRESVMPTIVKSLDANAGGTNSNKISFAWSLIPLGSDAEPAVRAVAQLLKSDKIDSHDASQILRLLARFGDVAKSAVPDLSAFTFITKSHQTESLDLLSKLDPWRAFWLTARLKYPGFLIPLAGIVLISLIVAAVTTTSPGKPPIRSESI